jgi:hypothetical protein
MKIDNPSTHQQRKKCASLIDVTLSNALLLSELGSSTLRIFEPWNEIFCSDV